MIFDEKKMYKDWSSFVSVKWNNIKSQDNFFVSKIYYKHNKEKAHEVFFDKMVLKKILINKVFDSHGFIKILQVWFLKQGYPDMKRI